MSDNPQPNTQKSTQLNSGFLPDHPDRPPSSSSSPHFNKGIIHEGEYVSIPSRNTLPINSISNSSNINDTSSGTPIRINSPVSILEGQADENGKFRFNSSNSASLSSLEANQAEYAPSLIHKWTHTHSILCVVPAPSKKLVFCGTQDSKILVFDIVNYNLKFVINCGHHDFTASILCLTISNDENFLFGAGSDSLVKVWDLSGIDNNTTSVQTIHCTHIIYSLVDIGDIFSISWSDALSTLIIGAQNASILWCQIDLNSAAPTATATPDVRSPSPNSTTTTKTNESSQPTSTSPAPEPVIDRLPHFRFDKFFDSKGPGGSMNRIQSQHQLYKNSTTKGSGSKKGKGPKLIEVRSEDIIRFAHNGYVYCMDLLCRKKQSTTSDSYTFSSNSSCCFNKANDFFDLYGDTFEELLISCGGDGMVHVWGINKSQGNNVELVKLQSLENEESVLSMSIQDSYLYVGLADSSINVWDLMTFQLIRSFHFVNDELDPNHTNDNQNTNVNLNNNTDSHPTTPASSYDEVLSIGLYNDCIFKASNLGGLIKFTLKNYPSKPAKSLINEEKGNINYSSYSSHIVQDLHLTHVVSSEDEEYNNLFHRSHNSVLTVKIFNIGDCTYLISGGVKALCLWDISNVGHKHQDTTNSNKNSISGLAGASGDAEPSEGSGASAKGKNSTSSSLFVDNNISNEDLLKALKKYISFKTISKYPTIYLEDSRHCAQFLSKLLISLGASNTKLLPIANANPVIYSRFSRNSPTSPENSSTKPTTVLWYAHYDVVEATADYEGWDSDPFRLSARDGNLYARGVSDNKGPTLAAIYAVSELFRNQELSCDVVFLIEGEEECGSIGFQDVVQRNRSLIGDIDWVLLSNSYWLDDQTPCLNYGLRGVINASITVSSDKPDRHSGVDGGVSKEPTMDLIQILGELMDKKSKRVNIPQFYEDVIPLTETEVETYQKIETAALNKNINNQDLKSLMAKWRNPSLTVHKIQVSGPNNNTVIPQTAKASISIRVVPNQDLVKTKNSLIKYLNEQFDDLQSDNKLSINIFHEAEPWLGDPSNLMYKILHQNINKNWGVNPLYIREGGSIPSIRFLEKCFNAPAAQIPCGQASDNAHLKNEKLRIINLYKLRSILSDTLRELGS